MRKVFYDHVRAELFRGRLAQSQVEGMEAILTAWEGSGLTDKRWLAYMLATTYHETAETMQPIHERGGSAYFRRMYDIEGDRPHVARALGNVHPGDGVKFAGRGYVQLTGRANYGKASELVEEDLLHSPDLAMRPDIASRIMFHGMTEGWFTGRRLSQYFNDTTEDWVNARRIINALDKADKIAREGKVFYEALLSQERFDNLVEKGEGVKQNFERS